MDWNKSNTILIIAFIILNIFLLMAAFNTIFTDDNDNVAADMDYINNVNNLLKTKNININCEIPSDIYILPVLETEYEIIDINDELVQNYLGKNVEAVEDVYTYSNDNGESLEIADGKKIIYTIRDRISGEIKEQDIDNMINNFIKDKNINS